MGRLSLILLNEIRSGCKDQDIDEDRLCGEYHELKEGITVISAI